jgi:type VI secretion system secreted protein VgrG
MTETKSQFESSLNNAKALSEVAKNQQTDPLNTLDNLKEFLLNRLRRRQNLNKL